MIVTKPIPMKRELKEDGAGVTVKVGVNVTKPIPMKRELKEDVVIDTYLDYAASQSQSR